MTRFRIVTCMTAILLAGKGILACRLFAAGATLALAKPSARRVLTTIAKIRSDLIAQLRRLRWIDRAAREGASAAWLSDSTTPAGTPHRTWSYPRASGSSTCPATPPSYSPEIQSFGSGDVAVWGEPKVD